MPKITIVLEYKETGGGEIWPVEGRSGTVYGYATRCPKRGTFCHRLPLEQFQKFRDDIFSGRKISYPPVPDVEIEEEVAINTPTPTVAAPVIPPTAAEEPIEEISNQQAAELDETPADPAPPVEEAPKAPAKRKPSAKRSAKPSRKRS